MPETKSRTVELTDPRALRAVAHPIRLELIGLLRRSGPMTATQTAARIGESPASCSFHLRQLAKYGLVEEAGGGRGRERPWRATAPLTSWAESSDDQDHREAAAMLERVVVERYFEQTLAWLERRRSEPPDWVGVAHAGDRVLYATPAELEELDERLGELLDPFIERLEDPSSRPAEARPVSLIQLVFPLADGPEEG